MEFKKIGKITLTYFLSPTSVSTELYNLNTFIEINMDILKTGKYTKAILCTLDEDELSQFGVVVTTGDCDF